jgi:hypothetical protein
MFPIIVAAAAYTAAIPIDADTWFRGFGAHPKEGALTLIASEVVVDPRGRVEACRAVTILGDAAWAPFTCGLIRSRGRFLPAKINDRPVYGVFRLRTAWLQGGYAPRNLPVWDLEVAVSRAPDGIELPLTKKVEFIVNEAGEITSCGPRGDWNSQLAALACGELPKLLSRQPVKMTSGVAVSSVQDATVRLISAVNK